MLPLLLLLSLCGALQATTLVRYDLEGLTHTAVCVLVGTCKETQTELIAGQPYTRLVFEVGEVVKGQAGSRLEVCLPGGEYQGKRLHLAGMPQFAPGEEVVLFLTEPDRLGHPWPVGLGQGKFQVQRDAAAKRRVFQDATEARLYGVQGASLNGMELEEFLSRVRRIAGEGPGDAQR
ncbi:MAG: hypothetical protein HYW07_04135 [Candidatus Latescibacteria bacterium]|nr:hypothetical protein [Candidatus Latescibacterota bacterium]